MNICENIAAVQKTIQRTALACGRQPQEVKLVAVSKKQEMEKIKQACACGLHIFGENYLQEARNKICACPVEIRWHFIGHLQSNKAGAAVELFDLIQTVDRAKVANRIQHHAERIGKQQNILVQVNVGREQQKSGVVPEDTEELLKTLQDMENIRVLGLMTIPPWTEDPEKRRPFFRQLKELADSLSQKKLFFDSQQVEISMGMSGDYTIAIEEGATMVRVGTALFGARS